ncbi:MAG TPA: DotU family type IV/VI secretion system protein [Verrucomicrobiae bacterium]|jgi:type VI secretion system protein ImpK|nr:DotU family type IV/VI secretion system protein [Verrucomicrobiae bacterium]
MKLLDLYEELFQYVCLLNRMTNAKPEAQREYARVRSDVKGLLEDIARAAASDARMANQARLLEMPVLFFVDNVIATSRLKFAPQWAANRLATEKNELAGDERFFDFVQKDLSDVSEEAVERLTVYYTCFGLGFTGMYVNQPEHIRTMMEQIFPRIKHWTDSDRVKLSEEAYKYTDTRMLTEPPNNKIILVTILFLFLSLSVLVLYYALYYKASSDLTSAVQTIEKSGR